MEEIKLCVEKEGIWCLLIFLHTHLSGVDLKKVPAQQALPEEKRRLKIESYNFNVILEQFDSLYMRTLGESWANARLASVKF